MTLKQVKCRTDHLVTVAPVKGQNILCSACKFLEGKNRKNGQAYGSEQI